MLRPFAFLLIIFLIAPPAQRAAPAWSKLFNNQNLNGWEVIGDGIWTVTSDGLLVGQRDLKTSKEQSWLYTRRNDFDEFDLRVEYWLRANGNSGLSVRDSSRARWSVAPNFDPKKTPSHVGYEIQLENGSGDPFKTGSIYSFDHARDNAKPNNWNRLELQVRHSGLKVLVNGQPVSQFAGDPSRSLTGPIGLQLHDRNTVILFRSVEIHEIKGSAAR